MARALIGSKSPFGFQLTDNSAGLARDQRERQLRETVYSTQTPTCAQPENVRTPHIWWNDTTVPLAHVNMTCRPHVCCYDDIHARRSVIFTHRCVCVAELSHIYTHEEYSIRQKK